MGGEGGGCDCECLLISETPWRASRPLTNGRTTTRRRLYAERTGGTTQQSVALASATRAPLKLRRSLARLFHKPDKTTFRSRWPPRSPLMHRLQHCVTHLKICAHRYHPRRVACSTDVHDGLVSLPSSTIRGRSHIRCALLCCASKNALFFIIAAQQRASQRMCERPLSHCQCDMERCQIGLSRPQQK